MGTEIQMVNASHAAFGHRSRSTIRLSVEAGNSCLADARVPISRIDQLIFAGIYRDKHIGEPSVASLIHGDMAKHSPGADDSGPAGVPGFFCFDIANGGCGLLQGIQLTDAFIQQRRINNGLVIAGDAPASGREKWSFPFTPAATAILLSQTDKKCGFERFYSKTYPSFQDDFVSQLQWTVPPGKKTRRNVFKIETGQDFMTNCAVAAKKSLKEFFSLTGTRPDNFDLYITSVGPAGFSELLGHDLDLINRLVLPDAGWGQVHTAGLGFGLRKAWNNGTFRKSENILFLAVGSGLTVAIAWYQKEKGV